MAKLTPLKFKSRDGVEFVLRTPEPGEGAALLAVVRRIIGESEHLLSTLDEFSITVEQEEEMIKTHLEHPDKIVIMPIVDGQIVGIMDFTVGRRRRISHQGDFGMSVLKTFQGKGIGLRMLEALIEWTAQHPRIETLRLRVHGKNTGAIALYKKCGFLEEGREIRGVKLLDGSYDDTICMARHVK